MPSEFLIKPDENILDPKLDPIFKALFTSNTDESKGALLHFLTVFVEKEVVEATIISSETPVTQNSEKQIRYDFSCKFNDGELATVEMALSQRPDELTRSEYYLARSFTSQENKGQEDYDDLKRTYQITLLAKGQKFEDEALVHKFKYYDEENKVSLDGKTLIVTLEMSKINEYDSENLGKAGLWGYFLKYANDKSKIDSLNNIINKEEGLKMAAESLSKISINQKMQIAAIEAEKRLKDYLSDMIINKREGKEEGMLQSKIEIAKKLLEMGLSIEQIAQGTDLSIEEIESLQN